jgi:hypothetical protein
MLFRQKDGVDYLYGFLKAFVGFPPALDRLLDLWPSQKCPARHQGPFFKINLLFQWIPF